MQTDNHGTSVAANGLVVVATLGVILGLLAVGVVSGTLARHVVQVLPAILAVTALIRRAPWANYAAVAIFVFRLLIMLAIWLFLLGVTRITTGHFTPVEIALTLVIGASCLGGLSQVLRVRTEASRTQRAMASSVFGVLQIVALWVSLQPALASI